MTTYTFPFGNPILPVVQKDRSPKRVFVLGVYSSAVHARWIGVDGRTLVSALAVASEPEIFWTGADAQEVIAGITTPAQAGKLIPANAGLNGPSGVALDECFLTPLGLTRSQAWLCDLLPESRQNPSQAAALNREYRPRMAEWGLPEYDFPSVPAELCGPGRVEEIVAEVVQSQAELLVTLGDEPLRWFASHFGAQRNLGAYGDAIDVYGRAHPITIAGRPLELLPLVHPRQAARLGSHSAKWAELHARWMNDRMSGSSLGSDTASVRKETN